MDNYKHLVIKEMWLMHDKTTGKQVYALMFFSVLCLVQMQIRTEVLRTPSST